MLPKSILQVFHFSKVPFGAPYVIKTLGRRGLFAVSVLKKYYTFFLLNFAYIQKFCITFADEQGFRRGIPASEGLKGKAVKVGYSTRCCKSHAVAPAATSKCIHLNV